MRKIKVYHVDAFTSEPFGGNAAGIVPDAKELSMEEMQKIARELNLSETAFILPTQDSKADFRIRYFTPTNEIDFCGHATVGLSWLLATEYEWGERADRVVLETYIGLVPVEWNKEEGRLKGVVMTQVPPKIREDFFDIHLIAEWVGVSVEDIDSRYPIKCAHTGNWHLLVPIKNQEAIDQASPKLSELEAMNREKNIVTTHLFTFDTKEEGYDLYTRDFAPAVGIAEDPVTGSANGALAGYLVLEGFLNRHQAHTLKIAQGHTVGRPGTLEVSISPGDKEPVIKVGGAAVVTIEGMLTLPN
ncbi:PhzF family phenazine biosynthesis protein [Ammoniphilus sp. CFH 90114]|uniref:PhzF family phenazine biosynthesis protein n=1 Tax=Ammoniphilus sp. CFH 90114 TaxID=2493665 RepID=UPI00100EF9F4|nr:PhzF family phenazine biosynthesis protein [Ammoniphilus sp. CFH 90114]RXT03817.1 PhzF family phenazine biosynthesis protein [Ammoniphilus sp. CFH 90114]